MSTSSPSEGGMGIGRNQQILIGLAIIAVLVLISVPFGISMSKKSKRAEVPLNVEAIRTAELEYHSAFSEYVAAEAAPREAHAVTADPVEWVPSAGFRKLSWAPEQGEVVGSYSVKVEGGDFVITGACDVDGDGNRAIYTATRDTPATMVTESNVY